MIYTNLSSWWLILLLAPLLLGIVNRTKAFFAGRQGPPLLQTYYDLDKLLRKGAVYSKTTTWIFRASPIAGLAVFLIAWLFVPVRGLAPVVSFNGDVLLLLYLMALARFFMVSAALDTGSAFAGMGASREVFIGLLSELALLVTLLFLVAATGEFSLYGMVQSLATLHQGGALELLLVAAGFFCILLAENCRVPVDDPNTHLELTMIHEAVVLDHGGVDLALIQYTAALKFCFFSALFTQLLWPVVPDSSGVALGVFWGGLFFTAILVGITEAIVARFKMRSVPLFIAGACVANGLGLMLLVLRALP